MALPPHFLPVVSQLAVVAGESQYAFRGTTSLVLQGLAMGVTDIDIICDQSTAYNIDRGLADFVILPLNYSETSQHKSYFGKYKIATVPIEIMGDWQIKIKGLPGEALAKSGDWSEIFDARISQITQISLKGLSMPVTTIATELKMFALMGRWTAFHKIKRQL